MRFIVNFFSFEWLRSLDFLAPLSIRWLILAPVLWISGVKRLGLFSGADFVWYNPFTWWNGSALASSSQELGIDMFAGMGAEALTLLIGSIEVGGAVLLVLGFAVRWVCLALFFVFGFLMVMTIGEVGIVDSFKNFFMSHGHEEMPTENFEMYLIYLLLAVTLFFMGAGRWFSLDWLLHRRFTRPKAALNMTDMDPFEIDATDEPSFQVDRDL